MLGTAEMNPGSGSPISERFGHFARVAAMLAGKPGAFLLALLVVIVWAALGPLFGYSDTWQLVINTGTTIVTFLMVFLIQNTQNRDQLAMQIKLAELIMAMRGAENKMALAEELSDEELQRLHEEYRAKCDETLESLHARRAKQGGSAREARS
ncbi:MAG TPA: low affinity iron permease family protein [Xanthobacteraceae bacterium]|nr:low affinity iron permease family protein [Xanthobacteraceae bacterium]